jgi:hypothetical protein
MSLLRNTDVKKHLGRAVPRPVSVPSHDKNVPNDADKAPHATPVAVTVDPSKKVEAA